MSRFKIPINQPFRPRIWQIPALVMVAVIGTIPLRASTNWNTLQEFTEARKSRDLVLIQNAVKTLAEEKREDSKAIVRRFEAIVQNGHRNTVILLGRYPGSPESIVQAANPIEAKVIQTGIGIWENQNPQIYKDGLNFVVDEHEYHLIGSKVTIGNTVWESVLISNISVAIWPYFLENVLWLTNLSLILSAIVFAGFFCISRPIIHLKAAIRKEEKFHPAWYCPLGILQVGEAYNQYLETVALAKVQISQSTTGQMIVLAPMDGRPAVITQPNRAMLRISGHEDLDGMDLNLIVPEENHPCHVGMGKWHKEKVRFVGVTAYAMGCPFHGEQTSEIVGVDRPVELIRKNGEVAQVILGVDYLGEWEEYYRYSAAITDVTEIVQARDLEKQARERFEQLQRAWRHDLLSSVKGTWDMFDQLAVLDAKFSNPIQQEAFEIAGRKAKLAYELVRDTRNIGDSIEKITMVIIPVSEIFDRLKTMYSSYNITYFDAESPERIKVDVNQFVGRGLANIVNNAIKYSGGLNEVIEIGFKVKGAHGIFYVKDQGIGMDAEGQAKILSGSYGVAVRLNQEFEGTGLGLYSAQQIFKAHNASISVKSQLGQGSIFFVKIPLHRHENESLVNDS